MPENGKNLTLTFFYRCIKIERWNHWSHYVYGVTSERCQHVFDRVHKGLLAEQGNFKSQVSNRMTCPHTWSGGHPLLA